MSVKINKFEIENVKRVKAVQVEPSKDGLTIIGGKNNQGKTSVLDGVAWALGGNAFKPSNPKRDESVTMPRLDVKLSNGLIVKRDGKNSDLKVIDPSGNYGGQRLLDEFIEQLALNLPKFMNASGKEKAKTLLQIIGVGEKLFELEQKETEAYNKRRTIGQIADQKAKYAKEMQVYPDAPKELVSVSELIKEQQEILARNGENQRKREKIKEILKEINATKEQIRKLTEKEKELTGELEIAQKSAQDLKDESTQELEENIANIEEINKKVTANMEREKADIDADDYKNQYDELTAEIESTRKEKLNLLQGADLPLPELSIEDGELIYKGKKWDSMSSSEQLKVAVAIVRRLNPECGFVLIDKLEQMDMDTVYEFGEWLKSEGLQAIATRVSTGDECSIIIEDGYSKPQENTESKWKAGEF